MHKYMLIPVMVSAFTGCAVGPDHKTPETATETSYGRAGSGHFTSDKPERRWWSRFNDPALD